MYYPRKKLKCCVALFDIDKKVSFIRIMNWQAMHKRIFWNPKNKDFLQNELLILGIKFCR